MEIEYEPEKFNMDYDIVNNPDKKHILREHT